MPSFEEFVVGCVRAWASQYLPGTMFVVERWRRNDDVVN